VIGIAIFAMTKILPKLATLVNEHVDDPLAGNKGAAALGRGSDQQTVFDTSFTVIRDEPSTKQRAESTAQGTAT